MAGEVGVRVLGQRPHHPFERRVGAGDQVERQELRQLRDLAPGTAERPGAGRLGLRHGQQTARGHRPRRPGPGVRQRAHGRRVRGDHPVQDGAVSAGVAGRVQRQRGERTARRPPQPGPVVAGRRVEQTETGENGFGDVVPRPAQHIREGPLGLPFPGRVGGRRERLVQPGHLVLHRHRGDLRQRHHQHPVRPQDQRVAAVPAAVREHHRPAVGAGQQTGERRCREEVGEAGQRADPGDEPFPLRGQPVPFLVRPLPLLGVQRVDAVP